MTLEASLVDMDSIKEFYIDQLKCYEYKLSYPMLVKCGVRENLLIIKHSLDPSPFIKYCSLFI